MDGLDYFDLEFREIGKREETSENGGEIEVYI
jgi:hypothetical protein